MRRLLTIGSVIAVLFGLSGPAKMAADVPPAPVSIQHHTKKKTKKIGLWKSAVLFVTAYVVRPSRGCETYTDRTASGTEPHRGTVAVDPRVFPFGTRFSIPTYGDGRAEDTGDLIKGNRLDLAFTSCKAALTFGARRLLVHYRLP
jgi:3D (Asp-Asp-Asp) domain-containing protein